jgi:hypothetical protein
MSIRIDGRANGMLPAICLLVITELSYRICADTETNHFSDKELLFSDNAVSRLTIT